MKKEHNYEAECLKAFYDNLFKEKLENLTARVEALESRFNDDPDKPNPYKINITRAELVARVKYDRRGVHAGACAWLQKLLTSLDALLAHEEAMMNPPA